ncbi:MAG: SAM-dependent methyltransferase, partial [Planctomycetes bacterium]|nr:SAM-dependent methyltransferase [Planctomycetota bacterium]
AEIRLVAAAGVRLPFAAGSFDAVVLSNVLCSVRCAPTALSEIRRTLRSGGELRANEHVSSERRLSHVLMHAFNPGWRLWNRVGCNMNRRTDRSIREAGFEIQDIEPFQVFSPGIPAFPSLAIRARIG